MPRDQRICTRCQHGLGDERHLVFACTKLQHIRDMYAHLFEGCDTMQSFMNQGSQKEVMNFVSDCPIAWTVMRSSLVGVNRGGQTRRKAPIHKWGLSTFGTFGEMYVCVRVRVGWYSACLQLHYPSFQCTGLLVVSSFVFCDVVCTMYARYTLYPNAACGSWCFAPVDRP